VGLRACYDEGKRCAETLFFDYWRQHGVRIKVARIFNTYGPRMQRDDGRVVSNFVTNALDGTPLVVYGSGLHTRSFCYVSDLIRGLVQLMATQDAFTGPVNLGNASDITVIELARRVIALTGSSSEIIHEPLPSDDPAKRKPDLSLARDVLGFFATVPLEEGLVATARYFAGTSGAVSR
jgi:UDP-glucuronate decarboxylase